MTVVDDAAVTPLTLNVSTSLRYGGERWWKILRTVVATLKIIRNFISSHITRELLFSRCYDLC